MRDTGLEAGVRKWTIPLTFVGLGFLGAVLFSERGRKLIRSTAERIQDCANSVDGLERISTSRTQSYSASGE